MTRPSGISNASVRPFGFWRRVRKECGLSPLQLSDPKESPAIAILNVVLGMVAITSCYLLPMFLVGHWHGRAGICFATAAFSIGALYFTWYRTLPEASGEKP